MATEAGKIRRFTGPQMIAHWVFALAFFVLAGTGLVLVISDLGALAAGGATGVIHRVAAVVLMLVPVYYFIFDRKGLARLFRESFTYDRDDLAWLKGFPRYLAGRSKGLPPQGRLNAGEKIHHALVILLYFAVVLSGLGLWIWKTSSPDTLFLWSLILHNVSTFALVLLTIGHIYFTFVHGALSRMTTGYIDRAVARKEHAKWVAELESAKGTVGE
jgi:formate dehydrogenase subunit gamma